MNVGSGVALVVAVGELVGVAVALLVGRFCSAGVAATSSEKIAVERKPETSILLKSLFLWKSRLKLLFEADSRQLLTWTGHHI